MDLCPLNNFSNQAAADTVFVLARRHIWIVQGARTGNETMKRIRFLINRLETVQILQ